MCIPGVLVCEVGMSRVWRRMKKVHSFSEGVYQDCM